MHAGAPQFETEKDEMRPEPKDTSADAAERRLRPRRRGGGRRAHPSSGRTTRPRLGPLEYLLLALIALGVAITVAMAAIDPSG